MWFCDWEGSRGLERCSGSAFMVVILILSLRFRIAEASHLAVFHQNLSGAKRPFRYTVVKISRVPLDWFCSNLQGLCKKYYLVSQESFLNKKICWPFIYKILMKNRVKIFNKISQTCHLQKKKKKKQRLVAHCFGPSKIITSHLFLFKRDVSDNTLIRAWGFAENGISAKTTWRRHYWIFLLLNHMEASSINSLNNQKKNRWYLYSFSQKKIIEFLSFFCLWDAPLNGIAVNFFYLESALIMKVVLSILGK